MATIAQDVLPVPINEPVKVHGNLSRACISLLPKGGKIQLHTECFLVMSNVSLKVSASGHKRILNKGREVVARFHGTITSHTFIASNLFANHPRYIEVSYNPMKYADRDYFYRVDNGERVDTAEKVILVTCASIGTKSNVKAYIDTQ